MTPGAVDHMACRRCGGTGGVALDDDSPGEDERCFTCEGSGLHCSCVPGVTLIDCWVHGDGGQPFGYVKDIEQAGGA